MNDYAIRIELPEGEVKEMLEKLQAAQTTIYECYERLEVLGVLTIVKNEAISGD